MWILVPTSTALTNLMNDTYDANFGTELKAEENALETPGEIEDAEKEPAEAENSNGTSADEGQNAQSELSLKKMWDSITDKTPKVTESVKDKVSSGAQEFQNSLNNMLEGVAVLIVTTCIIPLAVFVLFVWIIKAVTRMNFTMRLPKASRLIAEARNEQSE